MLYKVAAKRICMKYSVLKEKGKYYEGGSNPKDLVTLNRNEDFVIVLDSFAIKQRKKINRFIMLSNKGIIYDDIYDVNFDFYFEKLN